MYTFAISNRNRNEIDDILKDKYHNYLTRCEENDNLIYILKVLTKSIHLRTFSLLKYSIKMLR